MTGSVWGARRGIAGVMGGLWAIAGPAHSQGLDAHGFDVPQVAAEPRSGWRLVDGGADDAGVMAGLVVDYAYAPLVARTESGSDLLLVSLTTATAVVGAEVLPRLRLDASIPWHVRGNGQEGLFTSPGDARVGVGWSAVRRKGARPGVSAVASAFVPTGSEDRFTGHAGAGVGAMAAISQRLGRVGWTANLGWRQAAVVERRSQQVGAGPWGGVGVHVAPADRLAVVAEVAVDGTTSLSSLPAEGSLALRGRTRGRLWWTISGAAGITSAPGVPSWRVAAGLGLAPGFSRPVIRVTEMSASPPVAVQLPHRVEVTVRREADAAPLAELVDDRIVVYEQVFFREGSAAIDGRSNAVLSAVAGILQANDDIEYLLVEGHTNHRGSARINLRLSETRAASVGAWLVQAGIDPERLLTKGYGFSRPLLPADDPSALTVNRRVEFVVVRPDEDHHDRRVPAVVDLGEEE